MTKDKLIGKRIGYATWNKAEKDGGIYDNYANREDVFIFPTRKRARRDKRDSPEIDIEIREVILGKKVR
jgi:hypothetical protein